MAEGRDSDEIELSRWTHFLRWMAIIFPAAGLMCLLGSLLFLARGDEASMKSAKAGLMASAVLLLEGGLCLLALRQRGRRLFPEWLKEEWRHLKSIPEPKEGEPKPKEPTDEEKRRNRVSIFAVFRALSLVGATVAFCFPIWLNDPDEQHVGAFVGGLSMTCLFATFLVEHPLHRVKQEDELEGKDFLFMTAIFFGVFAFWLWFAETYQQPPVSNLTRVLGVLTFIAATGAVLSWAYSTIRDKEPSDDHSTEE